MNLWKGAGLLLAALVMVVAVLLFIGRSDLQAQQSVATMYPGVSEEGQACIACHQKNSAALVMEWGKSRHADSGVGCLECHGANEGEPDAWLHQGHQVSALVTPRDCATCHDGLTDTSGENVSIVRDWETSMMANSTKDPFWRAKVATELERNPHLSSVINDKCSKCHAPMANVEITRVQGGELSLFGPGGILEPDHALYDAGMNGVSCTLCHQIANDATLGTLEGFSGHYNINDSKTIYGQFSDIFPQPMINHTGYTPTYSAHVSDSALCASCHDLKTPFVDANGNVLTSAPESEFPEQMPYTEWQQSIFNDASPLEYLVVCHLLLVHGFE